MANALAMQRALSVFIFVMARHRVTSQPIGVPYIDRPFEGIDPYSEIFSCVVDIAQSTSYLAMAGILIDGTTLSCPYVGDDINNDAAEYNQRVGCVAGISGVVAAIENVVAFVTAGISNCDPVLPEIPVLCVSSTVGVLSALGEISQGLSGLLSSCRNNYIRGDVDRQLVAVDESPIVLANRSVGELTRDYSHADRNNDASCVINSVQASYWIGRLTLVASSIPLSCEPDEPGWVVTCQIAVSSLFVALGNLLSFLSAAISQCAETANPPAMCSADINEVWANMFALHASLMSSSETCNPDNLFPNNKESEKQPQEKANETRTDAVDADPVLTGEEKGNEQSPDTWFLDTLVEDVDPEQAGSISRGHTSLRGVVK